MREALALSIDECALREIMRVAQLGTASALDPVEICALLMTTTAQDTKSLLLACTEVFGEGGTIDSALCRDVVSTLCKYDDRWGPEAMREFEEHLSHRERVSYNGLIELPIFKASE
jgi:hypothetical protein